MTAWTDAVSAEFKMGRKTNPKFSLKMAMMKAKKSYKKMSKSVGKTMRKRGGKGVTLASSDYAASYNGSATDLSTGVKGNAAGVPIIVGGKRRSKNNRKSMKMKK